MSSSSPDSDTGVRLKPTDFNQTDSQIYWDGDMPKLRPNYPDPEEIKVSPWLDKDTYFDTYFQFENGYRKLTPSGQKIYDQMLRRALVMQDTAAFNVIGVTFDLNNMPPNYKPGLLPMLDAIDWVDKLYWAVRYANYAEMQADMEKSGDTAKEEMERHFAIVGPKCLTISDPNCTTHPNITADELTTILPKKSKELLEIAKAKDPNHLMLSKYTAVVTASSLNEEGAIEYNGTWYKAIPYNQHSALRPIMMAISGHFEKAATALAEVDAPLSRQCKALADTFREWKLPFPFEEANLAWKETVGNTSPFNLIVNVERKAESGEKALPTAVIIDKGTKGVAKVGLLKQYFPELNENAKKLYPTNIQKLIPEAENNAVMQSGEVVYASGTYVSPEYLSGGCKLPNDGSLSESGRAILTYFQNLFSARQAKEAGKIAKVVLPQTLLTLSTPESDAVFVMAHETAHNALISRSSKIDGVTYTDKLGNYAGTFEESKANILGIQYIYQLQKRQKLSPDFVKGVVVSFLKDLSRNLYRGYIEKEKEPSEWDIHYSAAYVQFEALKRHGVITVSSKGVMTVNFGEMKSKIGTVLVDITTPYFTADKAKCEQRVSDIAAPLPKLLAEKFDQIREMRIPVNNRAVFHVIGRN